MAVRTLQSSLRVGILAFMVVIRGRTGWSSITSGGVATLTDCGHVSPSGLGLLLLVVELSTDCPVKVGDAEAAVRETVCLLI